MTKAPDSMHTIRFMHCDPFNHLSNTRYLEYFINAREDHLLHNYGFDIYDHAAKTGESWVVAQNQIAYLTPARAMERVLIQSSILEWNSSDVLVEMQMWNESCTKVKAMLWTRYVHVNLRTQKRTLHSEYVNGLFKQWETPLSRRMPFEERVAAMKETVVSVSH
ncbi:MAG: acyl-CoA thioesterase [Saprospiraceae bacterium]|nr:acyl-CoA thioesterase [Saprospiraceae bacterium]